MEFVMSKVVLIIGAGATVSDAEDRPIFKRPPLDKGFFNASKKDRGLGFTSVANYMKQVYDKDILDPLNDSLEQVMVQIFADIYNPSSEKKAYDTFRTLVKLFNHKLATTTNDISIHARSHLYRILADMLSNRYRPEDISIITFNQDIQIEKTLYRLQQTNKYGNNRMLLNFPNCYHIKKIESITSPPSEANCFNSNDGDTVGGISVLKLHGSLNWYSIHNTRKVSKNRLLDPSRPIHITRRLIISPDLQRSDQERLRYTFPVIVPPVIHKGALLHRRIIDIWRLAESKLKEASDIIIFGYSCPEFDIEAANLIQRTIRGNSNIETFTIIDHNPKVIGRYAFLTGVNSVYYYKNCKTYIQAA
jgi:hypothetical protein